MPTCLFFSYQPMGYGRCCGYGYVGGFGYPLFRWISARSVGTTREGFFKLHLLRPLPCSAQVKFISSSKLLFIFSEFLKKPEEYNLLEAIRDT